MRETSDSMVTQSIRIQSLCGLDAALSPRTPREPVPAGSLPSGAHEGGWEGLGKDGEEPAL